MPASAISGYALASRLGTTRAEHRAKLACQAESFPLHSFTEVQDVMPAPFGAIATANSDPESRESALLISVARDALDQLSPAQRSDRRLGLFIGSTSFDIGASERHYQQGHRPALETTGYSQRLIPELRQRLELRGPHYLFATACSSSANAMLMAHRALQQGHLDRALVLGYEFFNQTTLLGFSSLGLLCDGLMQPFSPHSSGIALAEACAAVLLEPDTGTQRYQLAGGASLSETFSLTAANPDGSGMHEVMQAALQHSGLEPDQISLIKAHGTGSPAADEAEIAGICSLFSPIPAVVPLKPWLGHTLGACGTVELAALLSTLDDNTLPICDYAQHITSPLPLLTRSVLPTAPRHCLLNFFGFGGNNVSLIVTDQGAC